MKVPASAPIGGFLPAASAAPKPAAQVHFVVEPTARHAFVYKQVQADTGAVIWQWPYPERVVADKSDSALVDVTA